MAVPIPDLPLDVRLLNDDDEQIPPGHYAVTVTYSNTGTRKGYFGPPEPHVDLWTGALRTGECTLRVRDTSLRSVPLQVPRWIHAWQDHGDQRLYWAWSVYSPRELRVTPRPGYNIVTWVQASYSRLKIPSQAWLSPREASVPAGGYGHNKLPAAEDFRSGGHVVCDLLPSRDVPVEVSVVLQVFETTEYHSWFPRAGKDRLLVSDTLRTIWP